MLCSVSYEAWRTRHNIYMHIKKQRVDRHSAVSSFLVAALSREREKKKLNKMVRP